MRGWKLIERTEVVFLHGADGEDFIGVHSGSHDFDPDFPALDESICGADEFGWVCFWLELVLDGYQMELTKMLSGPTSAKKPILLTLVILASITSPLNGFSTTAWYVLLNSPGLSRDDFALANVDHSTTLMMYPYLPVQVPSTSSRSFC